jgi:hypothetical protein
MLRGKVDNICFLFQFHFGVFTAHTTPSCDFIEVEFETNLKHLEKIVRESHSFSIIAFLLTSLNVFESTQFQQN